jgi:hypothetical protein
MDTLGYASENEELVVYYTCKSRACPRCGHRATLQWWKEQEAILPDIPYAGIVFTIPRELWAILQRNRHLLHDVPSLAAEVTQAWARKQYGVHVGVLVVPHTFGRHLNFYPHIHILVSGAGLKGRQGQWIGPLRFSKDALMPMWRQAPVTYVREALDGGILDSDLEKQDIHLVLTVQTTRWWNIHVAPIHSKSHFLKYAARYVRRLPIAQYRIVKFDGREVWVQTKDTKTKKWVIDKHSATTFVDLLAEHIHEHYRHAIRYFGLWTPRSRGQTGAAVFVLIGQNRRPRPLRPTWAQLTRQRLGKDPLIDVKGQHMLLERRLRGTSGSR